MMRHDFLVCISENSNKNTANDFDQALEKEKASNEKSEHSKRDAEKKAKKDGSSKKTKVDKEDGKQTSSATDPSSEAISINPEHGVYASLTLNNFFNSRKYFLQTNSRSFQRKSKKKFENAKKQKKRERKTRFCKSYG